MSTIINPAAERQLQAANDARIADTKNLARTLFSNSYFGGRTDRLSDREAFDLADGFMREQAKRFPKNETADGRSQP